MRKAIRNKLDCLWAGVDRLLDELEAIPEDVLSRQPEPGYWSALQAVNHIYLSERLSLSYMRKKLGEKSEFPKGRLNSWVRSMMLKWALQSPLKYKSPQAVNMRGDQEVLGIAQLREAWKAHHAELEELIGKYEHVLRPYAAFRHPVVGHMSLSRMLVFFQDHQDHHRKQIRQILRKLVKSANSGK